MRKKMQVKTFGIKSFGAKSREKIYNLRRNNHEKQEIIN